MTSWQTHLDTHLQKVLLDSETIAQKVAELGKIISADYQHIMQPLLVVGILRGSSVFMSDLIRQLQLPVEMDFMAVSSYGCSSKTSGNVRIIKDISEDIHARHILIVEDIVDTGLTLQCLSELLGKRKPASIKICTLLDKPSRRKVDFHADYVGFSIPDSFVVGYGLDFNGQYRHLPYIGVLRPEAYE